MSNEARHYRPTRAEISLSAVRHNAKLARKLAAGQSLLAVIKANAYGHGSSAIAAALEAHVDAFAVAFIDEALQLRESGCRLPIVLLEGCFSAAELTLCEAYNLQPVIHHHRQLNQLLASTIQTPLRVWLKVDSGMHRLGFASNEIAAVSARLAAAKQVSEVTLMSHFANAEQAEHPLNRRQLAEFEPLLGLASRLSLANSAALLQPFGSLLQADERRWCRAGIMLYGIDPGLPQAPAALQPAMRLLAPVIGLRSVKAGDTVGYGSRWQACRDSVIATLAIGYADGYPRHAPTGTPVLARGQRLPLVGTVSMDMITIDATDCPQLCLDDEVELWGPALPVNEVAQQIGTIGYELVTRVGQRVPRIYVD